MAADTLRQIMTRRPTCGAPQDSISAVARQMASGNFGAIPIIDPRTQRLIGIVTDRDITCRAAAPGLDTNRTPVQQVMSRDVASLGPDADVHECIRLMEKRQVRRIPVVDHNGAVVGIVSQADLARTSEREPELEHDFAVMVEEVSHPASVARAG